MVNCWPRFLLVCGVAIISCRVLSTGALQAAPPVGTTWVAISELSDEFNTQHANPSGDGLDSSKWWDFYPAWTGRLPSQFSAQNSWVQEGKLNLRSTARVANMSEVNDPASDHWVDSAVITSRAEAQPGDYFEASIKTAGLSMPSSWWFKQGAKSEIDVLENIGLPSAPNLIHRETEMAYNTHFDDPGPLVSKGGQAQLVDAAGNPLRTRENFITYGIWWKSPTEIRYYYNGNEVAMVTPPGLFDEGLNMHFDMEVFSWVGFPTLESLADPAKNTMQVDWVRGYRPTTNTGPSANLIDNPSFEQSHAAEPSRPDLWSDCGKDGCAGAAPFEIRSNETAHSGDWALKIDNAQPDSFAPFKEIRPRDNVHSVLPGETIHQEVWIKLTEPWTNSNETLALLVRLNGESTQPRTGKGHVVLDDGTVIAEFANPVDAARELNINDLFGGQQLNKWVKVEYDYEIPATDSTGKSVDYITSLAFINNKGTSSPGQGVLFMDDFSLEVLPHGLPGDFEQDGDVDGADFLRLQRESTNNPDNGQKWLDWQENYGTVAPLSIDSFAVPEPPVCGLILTGILAIPGYRKSFLALLLREE